MNENTAMNENVTDPNGNVFADLGFHEDEAESLKIRAELMMHLTEYVERSAIGPEQAARHLGVPISQISALLEGKIQAFTVDVLVEMLSRAGMRVKIDVERRPA